MSPIRIGCVQYLNTLPLIEGLRAWKDCVLETAVPSRLIGMLLDGRVDVALAVAVMRAAAWKRKRRRTASFPLHALSFDVLRPDRPG